MAYSVVFDPANPEPNSTPTVDIAGATPNATHRLIVGGIGQRSSIFQVPADGTIHIGRRMPSVAGVYSVVLERYSGGTYSSVWTDDITVDTPAAPPVLTAPGVPTGLTLTAGDTAITARCTAPASDGGSPITGYSWKRGGTVIATTPSNVYTFTGLTNGTSYAIAVAASNAVGTSSYTATVSASPVASVPGPTPGSEPAEASAGENAALAAAIAAGGSIALLDRIYRVRASTSAACVLTASDTGKAEIRGSDVWSGWSGSGPYTSSLTVPAMSMSAGTDGRYDSAESQWPEQVFIDGAPQTQIASGLTPAAGQFKIDGSRHVVLGTNPSGKKVEVTVRRDWIVSTANLTAHGVWFRHAANEAQAQQAALRVSGGRVVLDDGFKLADCHGTLLGILGGSGHQLTDGELVRGGQNGFGFTSSINGLLAQRVHIHLCNDQGWNVEWEAGAGKTTHSNAVVFDDCEVDHNYGNGLWWDLAPNTGAIARNCDIHHNDYAGLHYEISSGFLAEDNRLWENGWGDPRGTGWPWGAAILISSSGRATLRRNLIAWNRGGITFIGQTGGNRDTVSDKSTYLVQHDQVIASRPSEYLVGGFQDFSTGAMFTSPTNIGGTSVSGASATKVYTGGAQKFHWNNVDKDLAGINATSIEEGAIGISQAAMAALLTAAGMPTSGSH